MNLENPGISSSRRPNRLAATSSPYLLQHAFNPVDWHPWGEEAIEKARREDRPIFLSIGYSACHWCHVMERESFEDEEIAGLLNAHFVPVKVDREERPDLDDLYMEALMAFTGRGGWPLNVWLTPGLEPFYGATYVPPRSLPFGPGLKEVLERIHTLWSERREELVHDAALLTEALRRHLDPARPLGMGSGKASPERSVEPGPQLLDRALAELRQAFDPRWGGFGRAPKFPAHMAVSLILRQGGDKDRHMALRTLDAMAAGGIRDHLGGGFARYSTDERWLVPHFEKMLYDNAQMALCYLEAYQAAGRQEDARVARETLDYLAGQLRDPEGGFHSAEDADSEGGEGIYYLWTPAELRDAFARTAPAGSDPARDAELFAAAYGVTEQGHLEGRSILHRMGAMPDAELARWHGTPLDELPGRLARLKARLLRVRSTRPRPGRDDKILAAWNGLALSALSRGYAVLGEPSWLEAAQGCASFLERELMAEGGLHRTWRRGRRGPRAFLEDHGALILGLLDLYEAAFQVRWLRWAEALGEDVLARFGDPEAGGFFGSEAGRADLLLRAKPGPDHALPSGNTLAALALLRLSEHLDRQDFREAAWACLRFFAPAMAQAPRAFLGMLAVLDRALEGPTAVVLAGDAADPLSAGLLAAARRPHLPRALFSRVAADPALPLHRGHSDHGPAQAFVCRGRACSAPQEDPRGLEALLRG